MLYWQDESWWLLLSSDFSSSTILKFTFVFFYLDVSTAVGWIAVKFGKDIHVPLRIHCSDFGDDLICEDKTL